MRIDRKYLPSSKFLVSLALAIMIILVALALNYSKSNRTNSDTENLIAGTSTIAIIASLNNIDTDKDAIPDWQEVLYGTDPKNSDTDKDGTTDGEEIKANRDPLKANTASNKEPNDKIDPQLIASEQKISSDYENLNPIEKMARNLISNIVAATPASGQIDSITTDTLIQNTLQDLPQKNFSGITTISDLNLIGPDPKTLVKNLMVYTNSYYIQTENLRKIMWQDLLILNGDLTAQKPFETDKINQIIYKYEDITNNLIKMPIPAIPESGGALSHLAIINDLEKLVLIDNDIIKSESDTSGIFSDLTEYNKTMNDLVGFLGILDAVLKIQRK